MVDIRLKRKLNRVIALTELRKYENRQLKDFALLRKGNRLSILPLNAKQWKFILSLE
jgi:predicted RNA-binding protein with PUA-like domain